MKRAILFDVGGTLIHLDRRFVIQTLNENGVAADMDAFVRADLLAKAEVRRIMRSENPGDDTSRWMAYMATLMKELGCAGEALNKVRDAMRARHMETSLWTFVEAGTAETLAALKGSGYRIGIVSNADGRVASFLEIVGLSKYFEVVIDSGVYGVEKPDPRIFLHACEQMGVPPNETYYIGDLYEIDVLGARAAGLEPILISSAESGEYDCPIIRSLPELPALLSSRAEPSAVNSESN